MTEWEVNGPPPRLIFAVAEDRRSSYAAVAVANGWLTDTQNASLVNKQGVQLSPLSYPNLGAEEIYAAVETFYRRFYFRPRKIMELTAEMMRSWEMTKRRLREGVEFFRFLNARAA